MEEFKNVDNIHSRQELIVIRNYWVGKYKLLTLEPVTKHIEKQKNAISVYLNELKERDDTLKVCERLQAAKERASKKAAKKVLEEEKEKEYQASLVIIAEEIKQEEQKKAELNEQLILAEKQLIPLQQQLNEKIKEYADEIGFTNVKNQIQQLTKELNAPIKTSCKHVKHDSVRKRTGYVGYTNYCTCQACGLKWEWDEDS